MDITSMAPAIALANTPPPSEATTASPGAQSLAARGDHVHPRLTSAGVGTLDATGAAILAFTRTFDVEPVLSFAVKQAQSNQPVAFSYGNFTTDGNGKINGCTVWGKRSSVLPLVALNLLGLDIFAAPAANASFSYFALQQSS